MGRIKNKYQWLLEENKYQQSDNRTKLESLGIEPENYIEESEYQTRLQELEWQRSDIVSKIDAVLVLDNSGCREKVSDAELLPCLELKLRRVKKRDPENKAGDNRDSVALMVRILKKKLANSKGSPDVNLQLAAAELLVVAASQKGISKSRKNLLMARAKSIITATGSTNEGQLSERLQLEVPERFQGGGDETELAQLLTDKINKICSNSDETQQVKELEALLDKVQKTMDDPEISVPEPEFSVLHFMANVLISKLGYFEPTQSKI